MQFNLTHRCFFFATMLSLLLPLAVQAQVSLGNLPDWDGNSRFFSDEFPINHPSLSLNGFDCGSSSCDEGLGLKQILEETYNAETPVVRNVWTKSSTSRLRPTYPAPTPIVTCVATRNGWRRPS